MDFFTKYRLRAWALGAAYLVLGLLLVWQHGDTGDLRTIRLVEWFALGAAGFLYLTLLVGPLYKIFPNLSGKGSLLASRGGFGDSALVLALAHASLAFWGLLGGFKGWIFLGADYKTATLFSLATLIIMCVLFGISVGNLAQKVFTRYPWFGKIGYVAGLFICIHALLIGSHFRGEQGTLFIIGFILVAFLAMLLAVQVDTYLAARWKLQRFMGALLIIVFALGTCAGKWYMTDASNTGTMSGMNHASMSMGTAASTNRYTLSVGAPANIAANTNSLFTFKAFSAATGSPVTDFAIIHDKLAHLVIVNNALDYYSHIHPEFKNGQFEITTSFPKDDTYRAYLSFEPKGEVSEQVFAYSFTVGRGNTARPNITTDAGQTKKFGGTQVTLTAGAKLSAKDIASGQGKIVFNFVDATGRGLTNLYPYLAAFGHLVMISTDNYSYIHVHPLITPFGPEDTSGPNVEFMPMGTIQPGVYKLFGQFAPNKELITVPFTIEVVP
jgi:hypothetical protein